MIHIILDLEFTPTTSTLRKKSKFKNEIIEIGAVKLNDKYEYLERISILIKPEFAPGVSKFVKNLTGITNELLIDAPSFKEAMNIFVKWCECENKKFKIYEWGDTDQKTMREEARYKGDYDEFSFLLDKHWMDLQHIYMRISKLDKCSLERALNSMNLKVAGRPHRGVDDAYNTAQILMMMKNKNGAFSDRMNEIQEYMNPSKSQNSSIGDVLGDKLAELYALVA